MAFAPYIAEYFGTFFFILAIFMSGGNAFVIGGALAVVILAIAGVSGGHVNPAVSLAMYLKGTLMPMDLLSYVVAQLLGGASAYYTFKTLKM